MKKNLVKLLAIMIALSMIFTFVACVVDPPDDIKPKPKLEPLPDIIDYSSLTKYYNVTKASYNSTVRASEVDKIDAKIDEKNSTDSEKKVTIALDDSTVKKIFYNSDGEAIMTAMEKAALPEDKMIKLVEYLTKDEGGFIDDYEKLEDLQDAYDASKTDANDKALQLHRYDMAQKIIDIFQNDGDQFARMAYEAILYAQTVVAEMHTDYKENKANFTVETPSLVDGSTYSHAMVNDDVTSYYKYGLKDYDAYTYIFAFNETNGGTAGKKELIKLYGYYYHYEKTNHDIFPRDLFEERLDLSYLTKMTDTQALRYRDLNQTHYSKVYRYTDDFYKKYNTAHFNFQQIIEEKERTFFNTKDYNFSDAHFAEGISSYKELSYSGVMKLAINNYITSDLKIADVNYEYSSVDNNVLVYNTKKNAWENCDQDALASEIIQVNLEVEQLKSQEFALGHDSLTKTGNQNDFSNALRYQIKSYQADYLRGIQASKKNIVLLYDDLYYYTNIYTDADKETKINSTLFEINREYVIQQQIEAGLDEAVVDGTDGQINKAGSAEWNIIKSEISATIKYDYSSIQATASKKGQVTDAFENMLVKRTYDCGSTYVPGETTHNCKNNDATTCSGKEKKFDTNHRISRLADTHQLVLYYSSNQVMLSFHELEYDHTSMKEGLDTGNDIGGAAVNLGSALGRNSKLTFFSYKSTVAHKEYIDAGEDLVAANLWSIPEIKSSLNVDNKASGKKYAINFTAEKKGGANIWYLDKELKYPVRLNGDNIDNFSFNMKLYPGYMISKIEAKA